MDGLVGELISLALALKDAWTEGLIFVWTETSGAWTEAWTEGLILVWTETAEEKMDADGWILVVDDEMML